MSYENRRMQKIVKNLAPVIKRVKFNCVYPFFRKMILVVPRQVRRTPSWKPSTSPYLKKNYGSNDFPRQTYYSPAHRYYSKKPFRPLPYGGDDFDQGHETVNHVHVPYGKDVTHGISFGKGYIPYDNIKSSSLPFVPDRYTLFYNDLFNFSFLI